MIPTMTIRIDQALFSTEDEGEVEDRVYFSTHGSAGIQALWALLRGLPGVLQHMTSLKTFAFVVTYTG
jgi:hypothetical protein